MRERVSVMDVGTLGKFLVAGRDARALLDRVFPCRIDDLAPGRSRYLLALDEAGYVMDDGLVLARSRRHATTLTSTSGGADKMEAWLRNWADRWDLHAHVVNQTAMLGAINVAGPQARTLLERLSDDDVVRGRARSPAPTRDITVAGVPCRAIRVGFVGELSFELHHPRSRERGAVGRAAWRRARDLGIAPHGLDALDVLRLEKGHIYLGQDTLPDDHPDKLGLGWSVAMDKPSFVGKVALERMAELPLERQARRAAVRRRSRSGALPLYAGERIVGRVTSCARSRRSGRLDRARLAARGRTACSRQRSAAGDAAARVVPTPFYDPEGARLACLSSPRRGRRRRHLRRERRARSTPSGRARTAHAVPRRARRAMLLLRSAGRRRRASSAARPSGRRAPGRRRRRARCHRRLGRVDARGRRDRAMRSRVSRRSSSPRPASSQGDVARVPAKSWCEPERVHLLVPVDVARATHPRVTDPRLAARTSGVRRNLEGRAHDRSPARTHVPAQDRRAAAATTS